MKIGEQNFDIGARSYIVGILNLTPDSFFDGGKHFSVEKAIEHAKRMVNEGADIIEIGGESSRPGSKPVEESVELSRIIPTLRELKKHIKNIPISVDTCKSSVAEIAIKEGASIINDYWCLKKDPQMAKVCAAYDVICCIMHNRDDMVYKDFIIDVISDIKESISIALDAGIKSSNIIIDPGVGFAKDRDLSLSIMRNLELFASLKYPLMIGTSRKSFIGITLDLPVEERLEATIATTAIAVAKYCDFIRVHDVKENKHACIISDAIIRGQY